MRLAVIGGAAGAVERVRVLRSYGTGWTSRILQDTLAGLLADPDMGKLERARETYARRRAALATRLAAREVTTGGRDSLVLWVPVHDEPEALVTLAAHGISAAPGSRYLVRPGRPHIRLAVARLTEDPGELDEPADVIALAAKRPGPDRHQPGLDLRPPVRQSVPRERGLTPMDFGTVLRVVIGVLVVVHLAAGVYTWVTGRTPALLSRRPVSRIQPRVWGHLLVAVFGVIALSMPAVSTPGLVMALSALGFVCLLAASALFLISTRPPKQA
ncbi:hypothetical protein HTZ77_13265 [Nonomuraea sp. SMC257]|uniref:Aminotransferase class I/II-fold pyridoxal phosphate-dependent enzyme n=1 Tax=Nonomuraea montanisoli TaxID=2741721 RepID=A0A7Y6I637_9ACTN|nr:hypothetical protein [Nonomuraea montanisoli]NUW32392.1 hypothetical protein [Nonomuraea montanisoli]